MKDAHDPLFWYSTGMKKHYNSTGSSANLITVMAERTHMIHELLPHLALAVAANEETQNRFRKAVLVRLSKIESMVLMIQGIQIAEAHMRKPHSDEEKIRENCEYTDAFVAKNSDELCTAMVKYIYGKPGKANAPHDRRRKWYGWEI